MKKIDKGIEPARLVEWKAKYKRKEKRNAKYSELDAEVKQVLKEALLDEQGYICCYCMKQIDPDRSHIEHFRPKSNPEYSSLDLDYQNLLASCNGEKEDGKNCGHRKDHWFVKQLMVSPLESNVETFFTYLANGQVVPTDNDKRATETISHLNLNSAMLTKHRKAVTRAYIDDGALDDIDGSLSRLRAKDADGKYHPFCQAVICVLQALQ